MPEQALAGLRVLELGDFIAPAYGGKLLADLGADVIKIEPPQGDSTRHHGPFPGDHPNPEKSGLFLFLNANKRSVVLDLEDSDDRERLLELVASTDVLIHNFEAARLESLHLSYEGLAAANPRLIMVSITAFGLETPYRNWHGTALVASAASGMPFRVGDPGRAPLWTPYCSADFQGGVHASLAALAALAARRRTGEGQHAWISLVEVMATYLGGSAVGGYVTAGTVRGRTGRHNLLFYPWEIAPAADGFVEVITMVDAHWQRFIELMGNPEWSGDERLRNRWQAPRWAEELDALWHPWMRERTRAELGALFAENRISFQPVNTIDVVVESEQLTARDFWHPVDHPVMGRYTTLGPHARLSETPWTLRTPPPLLGQHQGETFHDRTPPAESPFEKPGDFAGPLAGLRVLDHGHVWAGPLVGETMSELGAEVIKVVSPVRSSGVSMAGGASAGSAGARTDIDASDPAQYYGAERGKLGVTIDLSSADGKALYKSLVAISDIIVENFAPRVMPGLGLGYEELSTVNPRLIMVSMSAAGATPGPWRDLVTYGPSLGALYGLKSLLGYHDDPMPREDTADLDPTAAGHACVAILAALEHRTRSGKGQHIEMAQGEATLQRIAEPVMDYLFNGRVAGTQGNRYPGFAPHGIYRAAGEDEWIAIVARDEADWARLLDVAGSDQAALHDGRFASLAGRLDHQDELDAAVEWWTSQHQPMELTERLQASGVPAFPVMGPAHLAADENFIALARSHAVLGPATGISLDDIYQGIPWKLTKTPGIIQHPVPGTGADNGYVFGELLGISENELARLRASHVI